MYKLDPSMDVVELGTTPVAPFPSSPIVNLTMRDNGGFNCPPSPSLSVDIDPSLPYLDNNNTLPSSPNDSMFSNISLGSPKSSNNPHNNNTNGSNLHHYNANTIPFSTPKMMIMSNAAMTSRKRSKYLSPLSSPNAKPNNELAINDMLHELSFQSDDASEDVQIPEQAAGVSKGIPAICTFVPFL